MKTLATTAALALAIIGLAAPSGALARSHKCPHHHGQLAGDSFGDVWHHGASLYACTTVFDHKPGTRRLGPWTSATKIAWDGLNAVWSVRQNGIDRMWAANADNGKRWLSGTNLVPDGAGHPFSDRPRPADPAQRPERRMDHPAGPGRDGVARSGR